MVIKFKFYFSTLITALTFCTSLKDSISFIALRILFSSHPLASVSGSFNGIFLVGDNVGDIMLYGRGAGALPTGSAVVSDIVFCARQIVLVAYQ